MNEISTYTVPAAVSAVGNDYQVAVGTRSLELKRDVDFGVIPNTKKPTLYKSGAERIVMAFGVSSDFEIVNAVQNVHGENPFFFYLVRCSLSACVDGRVVHITDGYGSANTNEKKCGRASAWDMANTQLKIAKKRALVDAALMLGQLSSMFAQDIENDDFIDGAEKIGEVLSPTDPITPKQRKRIFALAAASGISSSVAKQMLTDAGFASTSDITQADYDRVCTLFSEKAEA